MRVRHGCDYSMRNKCLALLLFVALVVVGATTRFAIAQEAKLGSAQQTQIESAISKFMATSRAPGISVAVVENGELIWSSGFGFADLENHVAATSATPVSYTHLDVYKRQRLIRATISRGMTTLLLSAMRCGNRNSAVTRACWGNRWSLMGARTKLLA